MKQYYIQGTFQSIHFLKLLSTIYHDKRSGILKVDYEPYNVEITFLNGDIITLISNYIPNFALGEIFLKNKKITEDQLKQSIKKLQSQKKLQGEILQEMGLVTPHEIFLALKEQVYEKIMYMVGWKKGKFIFRSSARGEAVEVKLDIDLPNLIIQAVQHIDFKYVREDFSGKREVKIIKIDSPLYTAGKLKLPPAELRLCTKIDGKKSLRDLQDIGGLGLTKTYQFVYGLYLLNLIKFEGFEDNLPKLKEIPGEPSEYPPNVIPIDKKLHLKSKLPHIPVEKEESGYKIEAPWELIKNAVEVVEKIESSSKVRKEKKEEIREKEISVKPISIPILPTSASSPSAKPIGTSNIKESLNEFIESSETATNSDEINLEEIGIPEEVELPELDIRQFTGGTSAQSKKKDDLEFSLEEEETPEEDTTFEEHEEDLLMKTLEEAFGEEDLSKKEVKAVKKGKEEITSEVEALTDEIGSAESALDSLEKEILKEMGGADELEEGHGEFFTGESPEDYAQSLQNIVSDAEAFKIGQHHLENGDFAKAEVAFRKALSLGTNPEYNAYIGWCLYKKDPSQAPLVRNEAINLIKKTLSANPRFAKSYYFLGIIYKEDNQIDFAEMHFVKALELDKNCTEAKEELVKLYLKK